MNLIFESLNEESIVLEGFGSSKNPFTDKEAEKAASDVNGKLGKIRSIVDEKVKEINPKLSSIMSSIDDKDVIVTSKGNKVQAIPMIHIKDKNAFIGILKRSIYSGILDDTITNRKVTRITKSIKKAIDDELSSLGLKCELKMTSGEMFKNILKANFFLPKSQIVSLYILKK